MGLQQGLPLCLQRLVFLSGPVHGFLHIRALGEHRLGGHSHGLAQLSVQLPEPGYTAVSLCLAGGVFRFPVRPLPGQDSSCPDDDFLGVSHLLSLLHDSGNGIQLRLPQFSGSTLGHRFPAVSLAHLSGGVEARFMPAL